jgi:hypothetical protein
MNFKDMREVFQALMDGKELAFEYHYNQYVISMRNGFIVDRGGIFTGFIPMDPDIYTISKEELLKSVMFQVKDPNWDNPWKKNNI